MTDLIFVSSDFCMRWCQQLSCVETIAMPVRNDEDDISLLDQTFIFIHGSVGESSVVGGLKW